MNLRFRHLVLVAAAFISAMAVADCPISKNIPHMGVYYLCANRYWFTYCGVAYDYSFSPPQHHGVQNGLLWSKKRCRLIGAVSASGLLDCRIYKNSEGYRECFFGENEGVKDRLFN